NSTAIAQEANDQDIHDHGHETDVVFVTASPHKKSRFDVMQGSNILAEKELQENLSATIGETLSHLPGVSSTFFGPGASRPIIRGLGGDRIRVLINGIGSIDAASTSPDHAVAGDPLTAERVEVMRGASTLLYGSNAVGGVVNIIDNRIPTYIPENGVSGKARLSVDSVSNDRSGGGTINAAVTDNIVIHLDGYYRRTGNYSIPGYAESALFRAAEEAEHAEEGLDELEEEHEEAIGTVENSDVDNKGGSIGLGWIGENFNFGASFNINDSDYGVPGHGHEEEEGHEDEEEHEEEEEVVRINLDQKRFDLKGDVFKEFLFFEEARLRFGYADYKHIELEGGATGTTFTNKGWEGRFELVQQQIGNLHGSIGIQLRDREFSAIGEEAFVAPNDTFQWGIFAVEEIEIEPVTFEIGGRFDRQTTENTAINVKRSFNNFSFSAGAAIHPTETDLIGISLSRSERSPTPEELFSFGPHLATSAFEVGNINLDTEKAVSAELTVKRDLGRFSGSFNLYHTWYQDFIFESETGEEMDGLAVLEFSAKDAKFYGAELEVDYALIEQEAYKVMLSLSGDFVHARFNDGNVIPRIPAASATAGIEYQSEFFDVGGDITYVGSKTKTAAGILPTDDYTSIDLSLTWRPFANDRDLNVILQAQNITNAERRQHSSFLKDLIPMPGRNFRLSLNYGY
ncbi:MAG: TonB-dependent receptor, partial [Emcibacteraceae bacterium]|nr:TonB-dependent receptor [Emcibacteraceae bacterium]